MPIPTDKPSLLRMGMNRVEQFCIVNGLQVPEFRAIESIEWHVSACAYYRPQYIAICVSDCAQPASQGWVRNWNWPGSPTDREPYGVLCHELGHHVDWTASDPKNKGTYYGDYSVYVHGQSREPPITSYAPNHAEWFAEIFRLFVTNHALLRELRPITHEILLRKWKPVSGDNWERELGGNVPPRILANLQKKVQKANHARRYC